MSFDIAFGTRIRRSPFFERTIRDGATTFTVYNRMYMPTGYGDPMAEYWRLVNAVSMWDVAVERQVEVRGPDALALVQALVARKVADLDVHACRYAPCCDPRGVLINDPVLIRKAEDRFWFSIADSDLLLWARAIAHERGLDVEVFEPSVAPLAIQGPRAPDVAADLLGEWVRDLKPFRFREAKVDGIPIGISRSGWSGQDGYELYLEDPAKGPRLWDTVREAGRPHGIGPGYPNQMERIEAGLLSYGADTDDRTTPLEVRLGPFVDLDAPDGTIGIDALRAEADRGAERQQLGIRLAGLRAIQETDRWYELRQDGVRIGDVTSLAWSPRIGANIGLCLVRGDVEPGTEAWITGPSGVTIPGELVSLPFL